MRRSPARSSIAVVLVGFLCLAAPALASIPEERSATRPTASLRVYGSYMPDRLEWNDTHWGYGIAARTTLTSRWSADVGAARFASSDRSITPVTLGFAYGPESRKALRPWVEFGAGYYGREALAGAGINPAMSSTGTYYNLDRAPTRLHRYNLGGYFGLGFDAQLVGRLGLGTGLRIHGWSGPDGLIALQSGLTFGS